MGITLSSGIIYPGPYIGNNLKLHAEAGCLGVDMENASLFCIGSIRGIKTGAILVANGNPFMWSEENYNPNT
jgi:uridine phosphorylase